MHLAVDRSISVFSASVACRIRNRGFQVRRRAIAVIACGVFMAGGEAAARAQVAAEFRTAPRSLITDKVDRSRMVPTTGALNPIVAKYQDLGEVDGSLPIKHIQLLLRRPDERQAAFDAQVEALHTKGSPSFHKWLTPEIVGSEFGPSDADIQTISSFLQSEGFSVDHVGKSGLYIDFTGTAAQVEHTFQTKIHTFEFQDESGEVKYSAVQAASIPEALKPVVVGFVSLSNIMSAHMNYRRVTPAATQSLVPVAVRIAKPAQASPEDTVSTTNYAVGPQDFYTIYNESPLLAAGNNGAGVTVALLEESAITSSDVTTFRTTYGVTPAAPVSLMVDTGYGANTCTAPTKLKSGEEGEAILDVEWAGAVAPSANLLFMQCASGAVLGVFYSAEAVIDNNLADTMSLSYGQYEGYSTTQDNLAADLWEQAASQGETVVVSAGDTGAATEDGNYGTTYVQYGITASSFSTTAWNVSAGGTDFMDTYNGLVNGSSAFQIGNYWNTTNGTGLSSAKSYIPEMTWNDSCGSSVAAAYNNLTPSALCGLYTYGELAAGGGAPSTLHARPSWQNGTVFGLPTTTAYPQRLQPDVSLFASNGFWYHDLPSYESDLATVRKPTASTVFAGGTSFVAPQLAGLFALVKQATGERLGQPNYVLYDMAGIEFGTASPVTNSCNGSGASGTGVTTSSPSSNCIFYDVQVGSSVLGCVSADADCYTQSGKGYSYGILSTSKTTNDPAFDTNAGWDQATGIGSINITNLVTNWQSSTNSVLFTPLVTLTPATTTYTYGAPSAITFTAVVSGNGSLPTGSVTFAGSPTIGAIGTADVLTPSAACKTGGATGTGGTTCYESTTQAYTPSATTISAGSYTITGTYSTTNENYNTGSGTATITVNQQVPGLSVTAPTGTIAYGTANVAITAKLTYTGNGLAPTTAGLVTFQVGSLGTYTATCSGTGPITCSYTLPLTGVSSGTYVITATYAGDTNYSGITATGTLTYGNASTISGFTVANPQHTMYPTVTAPAATSNSSGAVTYSVVSGPATYQGLVAGKPTFLLTGAGSVTLEASQAAAQGYTLTYATTTFTVLAGSIWIGDTSNAVSTFDLLGNAISGSGTGLTGAGIVAIASPLAEAFDASGYLWVASTSGVSEFKFPNPAAVSATPNKSGGISSPTSLAIDGKSQIWIANSNGTLSALTDAGAALSPTTGYTYSTVSSSTGSISIDLSGNVWVTNSADNSVTKVVGAAAPIAPPSTALSNGTTGELP